MKKLSKFLGTSALLISLITCSKEHKSEEIKLTTSLYGKPIFVGVEKNSNKDECNINTLLKNNPNPDRTIYVVIQDYKGETHLGIGYQDSFNTNITKKFLNDEITNKNSDSISFDGFYNENGIFYINRIRGNKFLYFK